MDLSQFEVQEKPCRGCPFAGEEPVRLNSDRYAELIRNLTEGRQHLCHSVNDQKICRGGRDGYLDEPTDEALNQKVKEVSLCKRKAGG